MPYKKVYKEIKKYDNIVIARHVGADPDALASSIALKESIKLTFPDKNVFAIGAPANRFSYLGTLDKLPEELNKELLIVTDTPDKRRIDGISPSGFKSVIKIDHHPFVEKFGMLELIDDTASSASQMIIELIFNTKLKLNKSIAEKLYIGVVSDTERFLHDYTTTKTFDLVSKLIKETNIDFTKLYLPLYLRPLREYRYLGYLLDNLVVTPNGLGYIKVDVDTLKKYNVDSSSAGNLINYLTNIDEVKVVVTCSIDLGNDCVKCSIRSRKIVINEIASHYNGGGHALASGARPKNFSEVDNMLQELDEACMKSID